MNNLIKQAAFRVMLTHIQADFFTKIEVLARELDLDIRWAIETSLEPFKDEAIVDKLIAAYEKGVATYAEKEGNKQ